MIIRNTARGDAAIKFAHALKQTKGRDVGAPFRLAEFQERFVRDIIEPARAETPNSRLTRRAIQSVARKHGKSEIAAVLVLLFLIGPEAKPNQTIVSAATTARQARFVFDACVRFIQASPTLSRLLQIVDSRNTIKVRKGATINGKPVAGHGSKYVAIANKANSTHGFDPAVIILDEAAQLDGRTFFDSLVSSQKAQAEPLFIIISTISADPTNVLSTQIEYAERLNEHGEKVDPSIICHVYSAPTGCDLMDRKAWRMANPALGLWIDEETFALEAQEALLSPSAEAQFRLYALNQPVAEDPPLIRRDQLEKVIPKAWAPSMPAVITQETFDFDQNEQLFGGLDLSKKKDLTAFGMVSAERMLCKTLFFKPKDDMMAAQARDDFDYLSAEKAGWLVTTPGELISNLDVARKMEAIHARNPLVKVGYDPYMIELMNAELYKEGMTFSFPFEPFYQNFKYFEPAVSEIERVFANSLIKLDGNPLLYQCLTNARVEFNANKDARRIKRLTVSSKIDGAITLAMALALRQLHMPAEKSFYEEFGTLEPI